MRIINLLVFVLVGGAFVTMYVLSKNETDRGSKYKEVIAKYWHLFLLLFIANGVSFVMTLDSGNKEVFVQRNGYGGEDKEVSVFLKKEEQEEEWQLPVQAKKLKQEQLEELVDSAFSYFEENLQGDNSSLKEVRSNLDYSLDYEKYPFDIDFVADHYSLIDEEGVIKNEKKELLDLGYSERDLEIGIPVVLEITLWYEEQSFSKEYHMTVFPKEESVIEEAFSQVKEGMQKEEREAIYEDGFYLPAKIGDVEITMLDETEPTSVQVLVAGIILVVLLFLREQENKRKRIQEKKNCLIRSYPWFVNELLLLMGAGMQTRNILVLLIREYEEIKNTADYRKPLMEEIKIAVQAMEYGMSEEQVYYKLGRRLGLPCYMKIMTLLEQNVKRGGKGLGAMFEQEELQALEERKNMAKRLGEEAGTKLLGPMILLLLTIMLMIMLPAFWGFA